MSVARLRILAGMHVCVHVCAMCACVCAPVLCHWSCAELLCLGTRGAGGPGGATSDMLHQRDKRDMLLLCDDCGCGCHQRCLQLVLPSALVGRWRCPACVQLRQGAAGACGQLMRRSAEPAGYVIHTAGLFPGTAPEDYDGSRADTDVACRRCGDTEAAGMLLCDACE
jgi:hypothetical protein